MDPGGSTPHSQGISNNPRPSCINRIPRIDAYFFKVHFNTGFIISEFSVKLLKIYFIEVLI